MEPDSRRLHRQKLVHSVTTNCIKIDWGILLQNDCIEILAHSVRRISYQISSIIIIIIIVWWTSSWNPRSDVGIDDKGGEREVVLF